MDIDKWLKAAADYLAQYAHDFISTLRTPWPLAQQDVFPVLPSSSDEVVIETVLPTADILSARVWVFTLLSILIGFTLNKITYQVKGADLQQVVVYVAVSWVAFGAFAFAREVRSKGKSRLSIKPPVDALCPRLHVRDCKLRLSLGKLWQATHRQG